MHRAEPPFAGESLARSVGQAKAALLANREFRRALSIAINREAIIDADSKVSANRPTSRPASPSRGTTRPISTPTRNMILPHANAILDSLGLTHRDRDGWRTLPDGARLTLSLIARPGRSAAGVRQRRLAAHRPAARVTGKTAPLFLQSQATADLALIGDAGSSAADWSALVPRAVLGLVLSGRHVRQRGIPRRRVMQPDAIELAAMRAGQEAVTVRFGRPTPTRARSDAVGARKRLDDFHRHDRFHSGAGEKWSARRAGHGDCRVRLPESEQYRARDVVLG